MTAGEVMISVTGKSRGMGRKARAQRACDDGGMFEPRTRRVITVAIAVLLGVMLVVTAVAPFVQ